MRTKKSSIFDLDFFLWLDAAWEADHLRHLPSGHFYLHPTYPISPVSILAAILFSRVPTVSGLQLRHRPSRHEAATATAATAVDVREPGAGASSLAEGLGEYVLLLPVAARLVQAGVLAP